MVKTKCALAHSRAEVRLLRQPSPFAPSAHPRGAFYPYRNKVSYTKKTGRTSFQNVLPAVPSECFLPALNRPCRFFEPCRLFFVQVRRHLFRAPVRDNGLTARYLFLHHRNIDGIQIDRCFQVSVSKYMNCPSPFFTPFLATITFSIRIPWLPSI